MSSINKESQNWCYNFIFKGTVYIIIFFSYKMSLSKFLGHSKEPYGCPHCFPLIMVPKPHLIHKMCFVTPMCTHLPHE